MSQPSMAAPSRPFLAAGLCPRRSHPWLPTRPLMKPLLITLLLSVFSLAHAQYLVKDDTWTLDEIGEGYYDVETAQIYQEVFGITGYNGVKGSTLSEIWFQQAGLSRPDGVEDLQISFFEKTDFGFYAVFDQKDINIAAPRTVLALYNPDRKVTHQFLLSEAFAEGRLGDFRYVDGLFYLSLGNEEKRTESSYDSFLIYCFDIQADSILWKTDFEICRGQFDVLDNYVVSGFGGSNINDYVCLIDRSTGTTLDKAPVAFQPEYFEATRTQDTIYVVDYNMRIYRFLLKDSCVRVKSNGVRLRYGPSTSDKVFTDANGKSIYPSSGDKLAYLGESNDFYKVRYKQHELYISKRYSELRKGTPPNP